MRFADAIVFNIEHLSGRIACAPSHCARHRRGIAAVILLTSIGEGLHRFVIANSPSSAPNIIASLRANPDARCVARRGEYGAPH